jgi:hypothetical protein
MAATHAASSTGSMEALFRPSTRFRDSHRNRRGDRLPEYLSEVELLPGLTVEDVLATGATWEDFHRFAQRKIVWISPGVIVCADIYAAVPPWLFWFGSNTGDPDNSLYVHTTAIDATDTPFTAATARATYDFLLRLLATCDERVLSIRGRIHDGGPPPLSGAALSFFFQESQSSLQKVTLCNMDLGQDQIHALATGSRPTIEVILFECSLHDSADSQNAFVECLQSDGGPTELIMCRLDSRVLANALTGNSRVTKLQLEFSRTAQDADGKGAIFRALANNRGLVDLDLRHCSIDDENWAVLCESLKTHPSLISLDLRSTRPTSISGAAIMMSNEQKIQRTRVLADMVKRNTLLHTIELRAHGRDQKIYTQEVLPHLQINLYRPRVLAIKKADISLRRPLLGLALQTESVRKKSNLLWMFLSGNADAVLQSDADGEQVVELSTASAPVEVAESAQVVVEANCKRKR